MYGSMDLDSFLSEFLIPSTLLVWRRATVQWIKEMTPVIVRVLGLMAVLIYAESAVLKWL
jgi:hypothetical protein